MASGNDFRLDGVLLTKGSPEYEEARCSNFAHNSHNRQEKDAPCHPAHIAIVESVEDVQKCIAYAKESNLTVTVRTGGHNWFGCYLRDDAFLVDMSKFNKLDIDPSSQIAAVGPAVAGHELNEEAAKYGLCFSTGHCVGVPLGGFLLGGGLGWFFPHYGFAAEHVEEVTVVTASGDVVTATDGDDTSAADWMWLARGSASAFPGVVVSFKIKLSPLPAIVRSKTSLFAVDHYSRLIKHMNDYILHYPEESKKLELTVNLASTPPPLVDVVGVPKLMMVIQTWMADSEDEFRELTEPLSKLPAEPYVPGEFQDFSFRGLSEMLAPAFPPGHHWIARTYMYETSRLGLLSWDDVKSTFAEKAPIGLSHVMMVWCPERKSTRPACFGPYSAKGFAVLVLGVHGPDNSGPAQSYVESMEEVLDPLVWRYDTLEHPLNKETFRKSFPETADKLTELRGRLDPDKLFFDPTVADPAAF